MKKRVIVLVAIAVLLMLSACAADPVEVTDDSGITQGTPTAESTVSEAKDGAENGYVLSHEGEYYEVYYLYEDGEITGFRYEVFGDTQHNELIDFGFHQGIGGVDLRDREDYLALTYRHGGPSFHERYYDLSTGRVSRFYYMPMCISDRNVAYFTRGAEEEIILVVEDIFEPSAYHMEIKGDFSSAVFRALATAEFISPTQLKVTYWKRPNDELVTEIFTLSEAS